MSRAQIDKGEREGNSRKRTEHMEAGSHMQYVGGCGWVGTAGTKAALGGVTGDEASGDSRGQITKEVRP